MKRKTSIKPNKSAIDSRKRLASAIQTNQHDKYVESESESSQGSIYHYENFRSMTKSKRGKAKMAEFTKISNHLKEVCSRFKGSKKMQLSNKEINKIRSDLRYLYNADLSYHLIEKTKIGKALNLFIQKWRNAKLTKPLKVLKEQTETVKTKIQYFVRNHFFDENIPSDSDISSHHSVSEKSSKHSKGHKNGLNLLMKARKKIDQCDQAKSLQHWAFQTEASRQAPLRKFSATENSFLPVNAFQAGYQHIETPPNEEKTNTNQGTPSFIDMLLRTQHKTRSNSWDMTNSYLTQNRVEPSNIVENLLTEYLISLPSCLDEFYKVMGELYVSEILKYKPDVHSPTQLMKELLLGKLNIRNGQLRTNDLVGAMMQQAAEDNEAQAQHQKSLESEILNWILNENRANSNASEPRENYNDIQNQDINMNEQEEIVNHESLQDLQNTKQQAEPAEVKPNGEPGLNKREQKELQKVVDSQAESPLLDTQLKTKDKVVRQPSKTNSEKNKAKKVIPKKQSQTKTQNPKREKRAPKKSNQRVFIPKISNRNKELESWNKRKCREESINEFCKSLVEQTIDKAV